MSIFAGEGIELEPTQICGLCNKKGKNLLTIIDCHGFPGEYGHLDCLIKFLVDKFVKEAIEREKNTWKI
jgi:hypothetical protein